MLADKSEILRCIMMVTPSDGAGKAHLWEEACRVAVPVFETAYAEARGSLADLHGSQKEFAVHDALKKAVKARNEYLAHASDNQA